MLLLVSCGEIVQGEETANNVLRMLVTKRLISGVSASLDGLWFYAERRDAGSDTEMWRRFPVYSRSSSALPLGRLFAFSVRNALPLLRNSSGSLTQLPASGRRRCAQFCGRAPGCKSAI